MSRFCPNCGQPRPPVNAGPLQDPPCAACGAPAPVRAPTEDAARPTESESRQSFRLQSQRRRTTAIAVAVILLLGALFWLLLQPSSPDSPARRTKNVVFGQRVTEAVEKRLHDLRGADGKGSPRAGSPGNSDGRDASAEPVDGAASDSQGDRSGEGSRGRREGVGSDLPANVRNPDPTGAGLDAPPERSVGWLDSFFGRSPDSGPIRAGEGGSGSSPGAGNTNVPTTAPTHELTAAELTQREPVPDLPRDLNPPDPERTRTTNRPVLPANATLNDNLERLLRQHQAGTGDLRISLMWSNRNDLDLHVVDPSETEIYYQYRRSQTGGLLDIDMNASPPLRSPAVENIFWPERGAPAGRFRVYVNHFRQYDATDVTPFTVRILIRGRTTDFRGSIRFGEPKRLVHEFTLTP